MEVVTYVEHEVNKFFALMSLITFVILGILAFFILPVVFFLTKNAVHRCSRCLQKMGEKQCFGMPDDFNAPVSQVGCYSILKEKIVLCLTYGFGLFDTRFGISAWASVLL